MRSTSATMRAPPEILQRPVPPTTASIETADGSVTLTPAITAGVNSGSNARAIRQTSDSERLSPLERAQIIDAQATHLLVGTVDRLRGDAKTAKQLQLKGLTDALAVRQGRVTSIVRLRSQMLGELALTEEALGDMGAADARFRESVDALAIEYPETNALASARARYAAFLTRQGRDDEALALYHAVVKALADTQRSSTGMANIMAPYYRLLAARAPTDPAAVADFFVASQLQVRPGVADTQAVLARELSGGDGDGARLFRQATTLNRDIERARIEEARLIQLPATGEVVARLADVKTQIDNLSFQQAETVAKLSAFPQYRVVSSGKLDLGELQQVLRPDEAYLKMLVVGDAVYAMLIEPGNAQLWRADIDADGLENAVDAIRSTISTVENGRRVTYPFDAATARKLYVQLFGPAADHLPAVKHLVFEPDGAMLKLPVNLLITSDTGLAAYEQRVNDPAADPFDMRGIAWARALDPAEHRGIGARLPQRAPGAAIDRRAAIFRAWRKSAARRRHPALTRHPRRGERQRRRHLPVERLAMGAPDLCGRTRDRKQHHRARQLDPAHRRRLHRYRGQGTRRP